MRWSRARFDPLAAAGVLVALAVAAGVAARAFLFGSVEGSWVYPYYRGFNWPGVGAFALVLPCVLAGVAWSRTRLAEHEVACVVAWLFFAELLQLVLRASYPFSLETIIRSPTANSFWSPTLHYSFGEFLREFERLGPTLPFHAGHNMPGKVGLFFALGGVTSSPQVMGYLIILLSNLAGALAYLVARELFHDRRVALFALVLTLFVPCRLYFLPILNTVSPVPILLCLYLELRYLRSPRAWLAALLGAAVYATAFFEPLPIALAPVFAAFLARALLIGSLRLGDAGRLIAIAAGSCFIVAGLVWLVSGFDLFGNLFHVFEHARSFNVGAQRPYSVWVLQNLVDFGASLSACATVVWLGSLARSLCTRSQGATLRDRLLEPSVLLSLSCLATLLLLDLGGVNRGEVIRLWIFLACPIQIPVAAACARRADSSTFALVLACSLLQAAVAISMVGFVNAADTLRP